MTKHTSAGSASKNPDIAIITMQYPTPAETFASRDFRALLKCKATVSVYTLKGPHPKSAILAKDQRVTKIPVFRKNLRKNILACLLFRAGFKNIISVAKIIIFSRNTKLIERIKCLSLLPAAIAITDELVAKQHDVVHLFWGHYPSIVLLLAKPLMPKTVFTMFLGAYDLSKKLKISENAASLSDVVFTHSYENVSSVKDLVGSDKNIKVIHRGIELNLIPAAEQIKNHKKTCSIFTAGRLIPDKGFDSVLREFAKVIEQFPQALLRIAGDGNDMKRLRALAVKYNVNDSVIFLGHLSEKCVIEEMLDAKLFIFLSRKPGECLPNVVKEAMAAGCVCVVMISPGLTELIQHGVNGYIVNSSESTLIEKYLLKHINVQSFESIQEQACTDVRKEFDVNVSANLYLTAWIQEIENSVCLL